MLREAQNRIEQEISKRIRLGAMNLRMNEKCNLTKLEQPCPFPQLPFSCTQMGQLIDCRNASFEVFESLQPKWVGEWDTDGCHFQCRVFHVCATVLIC